MPTPDRTARGGPPRPAPWVRGPPGGGGSMGVGPCPGSGPGGSQGVNQYFPGRGAPAAQLPAPWGRPRTVPAPPRGASPGGGPGGGTGEGGCTELLRYPPPPCPPPRGLAPPAPGSSPGWGPGPGSGPGGSWAGTVVYNSSPGPLLPGGTEFRDLSPLLLKINCRPSRPSPDRAPSPAGVGQPSS